MEEKQKHTTKSSKKTTDVPRAEVPKPEAPKTATSRVEVARVDASKVEAARTEEKKETTATKVEEFVIVDPVVASSALDLLAMPIEAVAAYWLSVKRLVGEKKSFAEIDLKGNFAAEPFVGYLIDLSLFSSFSENTIHRLIQRKSETVIAKVSLRLTMMRLTLLAVAQKENPLRTFMRFNSYFPHSPPVIMEKALQDAYTSYLGVKSTTDTQPPPVVSHLHDEATLIPALLFWVFLARKHGAASCRDFVSSYTTPYFSEGMLLILDNFDLPMIQQWLLQKKQSIIQDYKYKMDLSVLLAIAIKNRQEYDDVYKIAKAYL